MFIFKLSEHRGYTRIKCSAISSVLMEVWNEIYRTETDIDQKNSVRNYKSLSNNKLH